MKLLLATGGARSGKSHLAATWARTQPGPHHFFATAIRDPADHEMAARIVRHQADRVGQGWVTHECADDLAAAVSACASGTIVIDCLTLWLAARAVAVQWNESAVTAEVSALIQACRAQRLCAAIIVVTNEVGSGIVPESAWGRDFRDLQGRANQRFAAVADHVALCVCGQTLWIKGEKPR